MESSIKNPLLDEYILFKANNRDFLGEFSKRREMIQKYSFAIPDDIALQKLVEYSPVIEIGAGRNRSWSRLLGKSCK